MTAQEILTNLLEAHDLKTLVHKDWILVNERLPAIGAFTQNYKEYENGSSIRLDIGVLLDKDKIIWESFAGIGKDELSATQNAFQNFLANSMHVFLSAFWGVEENEQVGVEEWEIKGEKWKVFIGNFGCKGDFDIPNGLFNIIEEQIKDEELKDDLYWFRIYYANMNKEEKLVEALKNNENWNPIEAKIEKMSWPVSDKFYSLRNFIILTREQ